MAKKKSVSKAEASKTPNVQTESTEQAPIVQAETTEQAPIGQAECTEQTTDIQTEISAPVELEKTEILSPLDTLTENTPHEESGHLHSTGEFSVEGELEDSQVLARLRAVALTPSEIYREAQLFQAQKLDICALLQSSEPILVQNVVDILRMLGIWNSMAFRHIADDDSRTVECVTRYISHCFKNGLVSAMDVADALSPIKDDNAAAVSSFAEKFSSVLLNAISQTQRPDQLADVMPAFTRLCVYLDGKTISRLLYDPLPSVRIAVLRSFVLRGTIDTNDLSVALILLKDKDEQVNIAVMRMISRFAVYPELVIPQILPYVPEACEEFLNEILDVFRSYGNAAVEPLIMSLADPREEIFQAARIIIAQMPQRFTEGLLKAFISVRTRELVKERIIQILREHRDPGRREEILQTLSAYLDAPNDDYPEWKAPDTRVKFIPKAVDNDDVYQRILGEDELPALSEVCTDEVLGRLLGDAEDFARINALNVIRYRKEASPAIQFEMLVWLKSSSPDLARAALDAYLSVEKDTDKSIAVILGAFEHGENDEIKKSYFNILLQHQDAIDALIRAYYQTPKKCANFIIKFLAIGPSEATFKGILAGIERDKSVACISETLNALMRTKHQFNDKAIRPDLIRLIREPLSYGHYGFMTRLLSLKLLQLYLTRDEERDQETISQLQAFYKECKNSDLKTLTKTILKDMGEEIFDFDDEEDDFEDLREEDEDDE